MPSLPTPNFLIEDWGVLPFGEALQGQLALLEEIHKNHLPGVIGFCQHPPVATIGSKAKASEYAQWQGEIVHVQRGGRVTYHGPEQLMIYPLINLNFPGLRKDLNLYLRNLENWLVATLADYGLQAANKTRLSETQLTEIRALSLVSESETEVTGVWLGNRKIASLGIGVRKWITYQGACLNVNPAPGFAQLTPCGFSGQTMTSMAQELNQTLNVKEVQKQMQSLLAKFTEGLLVD